MVKEYFYFSPDDPFLGAPAAHTIPDQHVETPELQWICHRGRWEGRAKDRAQEGGMCPLLPCAGLMDPPGPVFQDPSQAAHPDPTTQELQGILGDPQTTG